MANKSDKKDIQEINMDIVIKSLSSFIVLIDGKFDLISSMIVDLKKEVDGIKVEIEKLKTS